MLDAVKEREVLQAQWQRAAASRQRASGERGRARSATLADGDPDLAPLLREVRAAAAELVRAQRTNAAIVRGALTQVSDLLVTSEARPARQQLRRPRGAERAAAVRRGQRLERLRRTPWRSSTSSAPDARDCSRSRAR